MAFHGFDVYQAYLAMKQHFSNTKYDFFLYDGKVNAKEETYQQRSDFYFFESLARKLSRQEILEYLLSSFVYSDNPSKVWIGDIKRGGKDKWVAWQKQNNNLRYILTQELNIINDYMNKHNCSFNSLFSVDSSHPILLKMFIKNDISLETLIILDMVLKFMVRWDGKLKDKLWESLSFKIKKYKPFLSIPVKEYRQLMREVFV